MIRAYVALYVAFTSVQFLGALVVIVWALVLRRAARRASSLPKPSYEAWSSIPNRYYEEQQARKIEALLASVGLTREVQN